jgi:23S rRNA pseudouridine1911/1915/1917 synthase
MATATNTRNLTFTAGPDANGLRLDIWLQRQLREHSRRYVQRLIHSGHVVVNAEFCKANHKLRAGEVVDVTIPPPSPMEMAGESIPLEVLHEDADLIVINKPPGIVVHPAAGHRDGTLVNALLHHCAGQLSGIGGVERPGIVHRLDRDTSGCLVAAKTDVAHRALAEQFKSRNVSKQYLAIVTGTPRLARGRIESRIGRSVHNRKKMAVVSRGGREAITEYEVVRRFANASIIRCTLHTGRTHQIRVHLASLGHPILGDATYGRARHPLASRQMLHAEALAFDHPRDHKRLEIRAPLPQDMEQLIRALEAEDRAAASNQKH